MEMCLRGVCGVLCYWWHSFIVCILYQATSYYMYCSISLGISYLCCFLIYLSIVLICIYDYVYTMYFHIKYIDILHWLFVYLIMCSVMLWYTCENQVSVFKIKTVSSGTGLSSSRPSHDQLIFVIGILVMVKRCLYIKAPLWPSLNI